MKKKKIKKPNKRISYKALYLTAKALADKVTQDLNYFKGVAETGFKALCSYGHPLHEKLVEQTEGFRRRGPIKVQQHEWIALVYYASTMERFSRGQEKFDLPSSMFIHGQEVTW